MSTAVCASALIVAGAAAASYNPSLLVAGTNNALGRGVPVVIGVAQDPNDDATGMATVYSPLGYGVTLTQPAGTILGSISGIVKVGSLGGTRVSVEGTVRADNPANHVGNTCSPGGM